MKVNMHEAKSQLSKLGKLAWEGEKIIITEAGEPYLRLVPYQARLKERKPGGLVGKSGSPRISTRRPRTLSTRSITRKSSRMRIDILNPSWKHPRSPVGTQV